MILASGSYDETIKLWKVESNFESKVERKVKSKVTS